jgi:hypothetical protein
MCFVVEDIETDYGKAKLIPIVIKLFGIVEIYITCSI